MIELNNICKTYGDKAILKNISTTINKGKLTAFIGANGAGKSTLLNIIANLSKNYEGQVKIDNKDIKEYNLNEFAKKLSILKQNNHLNINLKVKELVEFGRFPHSQGNIKNEDKIHIFNALDLMDLIHLQDKFLNELSGGERQRAFIAMTIAQNTDYILLDEPLNNLDMKHCKEIMQLLQKLVQEQNKSIIVVLHDINFASFYADEILAIKDNKLHIHSACSNVINAEILQEVFDMPFDILRVNDKKLSVYY